MALSKTTMRKIRYMLTQKHQGKKIVFIPNDKKLTSATKVLYMIDAEDNTNPSRSCVVDLIQEINYRGVVKVNGLGKGTVETALINYILNDMDKGIMSLNKFKEYTDTETVQAEENSSLIEQLTSTRWGNSENLLAKFKITNSLIGTSNPNAATELSSKDSSTIGQFLLAAFSVIVGRFTNKNDIPAGKNVGAILVNQSGKLLSWGLNTTDVNSTFHAEVNTIQAFIKNGGQVSDLNNGYLFSTHQPCAMCSGMIKKVGGGNIKVHYALTDQTVVQNFLTENTDMFHYNMQNGFGEAINAPLNESSNKCTYKNTVDELVTAKLKKLPENCDTDDVNDRIILHLLPFLNAKGEI